MNGISISDLRPCLLVNPDISRRGGQHYERENEREVPTADGSKKTEWETKKTIDDPEEFAEATQLQSKAKYAFGKLGRHTAGGIVVNREKRAEVEALIAEWRAAFAEFNARATTTRVECYVWVFDIVGDNAQNLQTVLDQLADYLEQLESAVAGVKPEAMRDVLKRMAGFTDLLPDTVAGTLETAIETARARANKISRDEKRIVRLEAALAEELGTADAKAIEEAAQRLLSSPLTADIAEKAARVTKILETKQDVADELEKVRERNDTSAVRLARFALLGNKVVAEAEDDEDMSGSLGAAQAAQRFARFSGTPAGASFFG